MIPQPPASCRRESQKLFVLSLLPAVGVVGLLVSGHALAALALFWAAFFLIGYATIWPRARWFAASVRELPAAQAQAGEVWITIDDGPDPKTTPAMLDLLDQHGAKAGFFLIGDKARQYPDLVREIAQRGHVIGNHSQTHPAGRFWTLRPAAMWKEIAGCQQTLTDILGVAPVWFRPPVGHHNLFIGPPLKALGLTMAIWNCRGFDGIDGNAAKVLDRIARSLQPGSIILLHEANSMCQEVLSGTLKFVRERGLKACDGPAQRPDQAK
jgi:peptidoglycan/xylan/chitin deacetylase (PgdA/CDA1 family)